MKNHKSEIVRSFLYGKVMRICEFFVSGEQVFNVYIAEILSKSSELLNLIFGLAMIQHYLYQSKVSWYECQDS